MEAAAAAAAMAAAAAEESQVDEELILSLTQQSQSQWCKYWCILGISGVHCSGHSVNTSENIAKQKRWILICVCFMEDEVDV